MKLDDPIRLQALQTSGLMGKSPTQRLAHLAYSACQLLQSDVCLINALDALNQRTIVGFPPGDWPDMPVGLTGCRGVILSGQTLAVPDVEQHPTLCEMPWGAQYRGYLGSPIEYDDQVIGSICVLSFQPREWKNYDIFGLEGVARLVGMSLENPEH